MQNAGPTHESPTTRVVEKYSDSVKALTMRYEEGVLFLVLEDDEVKWEHWVEFSQKSANRAGGVAFYTAAREQDYQARALLEKSPYADLVSAAAEAAEVFDEDDLERFARERREES